MIQLAAVVTKNDFPVEDSTGVIDPGSEWNINEKSIAQSECSHKVENNSTNYDAYWRYNKKDHSSKERIADRIMSGPSLISLSFQECPDSVLSGEDNVRYTGCGG